MANKKFSLQEDDKPTRQALQAAAWGNPVPKTAEDWKKLAAKVEEVAGRGEQGER